MTVLDISELTDAICEALDLEPRFVADMTITPFTVTATVYAQDENGSKYINPDGEAAVTIVEFKVLT